jgi:hypothetical protein
VIPSATSQKGWLMPKALCLIGMVMAILVLIIFLADLGLGLGGLIDLAPFRYASLTMDIIFVISAAALAYVAWATFREQK